VNVARCLGHDLGEIRPIPDDVLDRRERQARTLERPGGDDTGFLPAYRLPVEGVPDGGPLDRHIRGLGPHVRSFGVDAEVERAPEGES
jgi:hypothetical protein